MIIGEGGISTGNRAFNKQNMITSIRKMVSKQFLKLKVSVFMKANDNLFNFILLLAISDESQKREITKPVEKRILLGLVEK